MILGWKRPGKVGRRHFFIRPHGQAVKTSPFHGGNSSSILDGVTKQRAAKKAAFYIICGYGGTGRRVGFRFLWSTRGGSSPLNRTISGTHKKKTYEYLIFLRILKTWFFDIGVLKFTGNK